MRLMAGVKAPVVYGYGSLAAEIMAMLVERLGVFMRFMALEWLWQLSGLVCGQDRLETGEMAGAVERPGWWLGSFRDRRNGHAPKG